MIRLAEIEELERKAEQALERLRALEAEEKVIREFRRLDAWDALAAAKVYAGEPMSPEQFKKTHPHMFAK